MRWFIPLEQLFMYRLKKAPPDRRLNDYIVEYKRTGDEQYLAYFLHYYEASLNIRTEKFCEATFETIAYAVRKREQSGKPDFNMIFNFAEEVDGRMVVEFLGLWVY